MPTIAQQLNALRGQAAKYQQQKAYELRKMMKGSFKTPNNHSFLAAGEQPTPPISRAAGGGVLVQGGTPINDKTVADYIRLLGGNPYLKKMEALQARAAEPQPVGRQNVGRDIAANAEALRNMERTPEQDLLLQLMESFQEQRDAANAANEKRYGEGRSELTGLRGRNQERVKNFGVAAREDIDERLQESLMNIQADAAARGMGSSSLFSALGSRAARDTAREQQRLSEMVDDRSSRYDTQDTNSLVNFVERRTDQAPDFNMLAQLAQQYGQSGAGQQRLSEEIAQLRQQMGQQGQRQPYQQVPYYPVYQQSGNGISAGQYQNMMGGGFNFGNFLGNVNQQIAGGNQGGGQQRWQQERDARMQGYAANKQMLEDQRRNNLMNIAPPADNILTPPTYPGQRERYYV